MGGGKKGRKEEREEGREGREKEVGKESRRKENFCTSSICKQSERSRATKQHIPFISFTGQSHVQFYD